MDLAFMTYWGQSIVQSRADCSLSAHPTHCPWDYEVLHSGWWEQALFPALHQHQALSPRILPSGSFPPWVVSSPTGTTCSALLSRTLPWALQLPWRPGLPISSYLPRGPPSSASVPVYTEAWELQDGQQGLWKSHLIGFLSQRSLVFVASCLVSWKLFYICLFFLFWFEVGG